VRIDIYPEYPRYFRYHGRPIYLAGSTMENGWTPISRTDFDYVLDIAENAAFGGNLARITPFINGDDLIPWAQLPRGRSDLASFNPSF